MSGAGGLDALREQFDGLGELPVDERAGVLETLNDAIVAELRAMDEE